MASFELVIEGGTVVDGSGAEPVRADVAISGGRIVEVRRDDAGGPRLSAAATRVLDAAGAIVTPGFVDLHCHYDGQVSWDSDLMPSSIHGVTTCVSGNCGVGFAPVRAQDHATLINLMEGVEDIPGAALAEGIRWGWDSFPEYMSVLDAMPHAIDFAAQVPHDAVRVYVMGARGVAGEPATEADIAEMAKLTRAALEAGAIGFSTGRSDVHRSAAGKTTPAAEASARELEGLARALSGLGHGVLQAVSDFDMETAPEHFDAEMTLLERMAEVSGRPLSISLSQRDLDPMQWRKILARVEAGAARGLGLRVQVAPRAIGVILGLELTFHPLMGFPTYQKVAHLPLAERARALATPEARAALLSEKSQPLAGDGSPIPPLADKLLARLDQLAFRMFRLGDTPSYEPTLAESLGAAARMKGQKPLEALLDALLEDGGRGLIYFPIYNYVQGNLDAVGEMLAHPLALAGLSDGGAHVGTVCDASFPTFLLTHWVRDRAQGKLSLARAVEMLTSAGARHLGLRDRGLLAPGMKADVNVIDLEQLRLLRPRLVKDLPAGGQRLLQEAIGYRATVVSGEIVVQDGKLTGARPGRLVRGGV